MQEYRNSFVGAAPGFTSSCRSLRIQTVSAFVSVSVANLCPSPSRRLSRPLFDSTQQAPPDMERGISTQLATRQQHESRRIPREDVSCRLSGRRWAAPRAMSARPPRQQQLCTGRDLRPAFLDPCQNPGPCRCASFREFATPVLPCNGPPHLPQQRSVRAPALQACTILAHPATAFDVRPPGPASRKLTRKWVHKDGGDS